MHRIKIPPHQKKRALGPEAPKNPLEKSPVVLDQVGEGGAVGRAQQERRREGEGDLDSDDHSVAVAQGHWDGKRCQPGPQHHRDAVYSPRPQVGANPGLPPPPLTTPTGG